MSLMLITMEFQRISNENARKELEDADGLTEEKVDKVVEGFLKDVKENLIEEKGWPTVFSAYIVSKAALKKYANIPSFLFRNTKLTPSHLSFFFIIVCLWLWRFCNCMFYSP